MITTFKNSIKKISSSTPFFKLFSGRFILTIVAAVVFYQITMSICSVILQKIDELKIDQILPILNTVMLILSNIFTFYFVKNTMQKQPQEDKENDG